MKIFGYPLDIMSQINRGKLRIVLFFVSTAIVTVGIHNLPKEDDEDEDSKPLPMIIHRTILTNTEVNPENYGK